MIFRCCAYGSLRGTRYMFRSVIQLGSALHVAIGLLGIRVLGDVGRVLVGVCCLAVKLKTIRCKCCPHRYQGFLYPGKGDKRDYVNFSN